VILHCIAFVIWDVGSRPPARLVADVRHALASPTAVSRGIWQFVLGAIILFAGAMLMLSVTLVDVRREFTVLESIAVVAGLCIEMLIGTTLRDLRR